MAAHLGDLGLVERPRLGEDRLGDDELADVVERAAELEQPKLDVVALEPQSDLVRHPCDAYGMAARIWIARFDRLGEEEERHRPDGFRSRCVYPSNGGCPSPLREWGRCSSRSSTRSRAPAGPTGSSSASPRSTRSSPSSRARRP